MAAVALAIHGWHRREVRDEEAPFLAPFTRRFESVFATARLAEKHGAAGFSRAGARADR
jgi:hypothetical protein